MQCPEHKVEMRKVKITYGLVDHGLARALEEKEGYYILGGCDVGEFGKYGYVCPIDKEAYVFVDGKLTKYSEEL